jgi:hypothetical protein
VTLQTRVAENFRLCRWGDERMVKRAQTVSEDPHRRERKFLKNFRQFDVTFFFSLCAGYCSLVHYSILVTAPRDGQSLFNAPPLRAFEIQF